MKKVYTLAVAMAAVAGIAGSGATAAMAANVYSVPAASASKGGTSKKPIATKIGLTFQTDSTLGDTFQPKPVVKFKLSFEGIRVNKAVLKALTSCKVTPDDAEEASAAQCPAKSVIGGGVLTSLVGQPETVFNPALRCELPFKIYNSGAGSMSLFIDAKPPTCPIPVTKWIPLTNSQAGNTVTLGLAVPKSLQEIAPNTFASVAGSTLSINNLKGKVKGKSTPLVESTGCSDKKRTVGVVFTDIGGASGKASKTIAC